MRCKNSFTLVPADDQSIPVGAPLDIADSDLEPMTETAVATAIADASEAVKEADDVAAAKAEVAAEAQAPPTPRVQLATLAGAVALLCGGVALVCASISVLCFLVVPLSAMGLAGGLIALAIALTARRRRLVLPIAGTVASSGMLLTALAIPGLLGPTYQLHFGARRIETAPTVMRAIPIGGIAAPKDLPEWIDASKFALQQGDLHLQIVNVSLAPAAVNAKAAAKAAPADLLQIRVRAMLTDRKANDKPLDFSEFRKKHPFDGTSRPLLRDVAGKFYPLRDTQVVESVGGKRRADLFPVHTAEEALVFEAPANGWMEMKLELPGQAWNATGTYRFVIPATMMNANKTGAGVPTKN